MSAKGWCSIVIAQTVEARHRLVMRLMLNIGAIILFVGVLGFIASLVAVRWALAPFDRIGRALAERRAQDSAPLQVESPRETQALVDAINDASRRLHDGMSKLEGFTAVAAHQIRTPLATLGVQAELLLGDRTAAARRPRVDRLRKHVAALSRLTNQVLGEAMVSYRRSAHAPRQRKLRLGEIQGLLEADNPDFHPVQKGRRQVDLLPHHGSGVFAHDAFPRQTAHLRHPVRGQVLTFGPFAPPVLPAHGRDGRS